MRISCPGFARILDAEGRYALLINKSQEEAEDGRRVFTPIGGALQLKSPECKQYLIETFGAHSFEKGLDLRFQVPDSMVPEINRWIRSPLRFKMRETSAAREVDEEIVTKENQILSPWDLETASERFGHFCYHSGERQDPESGKKTPTHYIVEVYDWMFATAEPLAKLQRAAEGPNPRVYFASEAEIRRCRTDAKEEIGDISKTLLR